MSTCQHRSTTFSRDICPDPCGVMHTYCDDCDGMVDRCAHGYVDNPAAWTFEQAQAAQAELDELERTDPDVAAAAASYDRMVERVTGRCGDKLWPGLVNAEQQPFCKLPAGHSSAHQDGDCRWGTFTDTAAPAERADTVYAEPAQVTDADMQTARVFVSRFVHNKTTQVRFVAVEELAQTLAAERAAIHARYEAVAAELDEQAMRPGDTADHAADLIRRVAVQ